MKTVTQIPLIPRETPFEIVLLTVCEILASAVDAIAKIIGNYNAEKASGVWGKWEKIKTDVADWNTAYTI